MSWVLFLSAFAYYLSGLCGTIPSYRDSGDLIASIHTLGIAHPPGYALYVLIGKAFVTLLPIGNIPYRINVMSAMFAASASAILFRLIYRSFCPGQTLQPGDSFAPVQRSDLAGFLAAALIVVLWASSPAVVALARVAEMYTMAVCIAAAILYCLLHDSPGGFSLAAFLLGLGLSVHPTLMVLTPMFVVRFRQSGRQGLRPILFFLLGLTVFLYLPIRASQHPVINWGDPSSWRNFWRVVTRADYGGLKLHPEQSAFSWSASDILAQMRYFAAAFRQEWGWGALALGGVGIAAGLWQKDSRRQVSGVLACWFLAGPAFFLLSNLPLKEATTPAILQPYLLLTSVLWALLVGTGMKTIMAPLQRGWLRAGIVVLVAGLMPLAHRAIPASQRHDFYAYDYARNLLRSLPAGAVLYEPDDPTHFSIAVLQTVENRRNDVILLNFFRTRWGYEAIKRRWPDLLPPISIGSGPELERMLWAYSARQRRFYAELPQKLSPHPYRAEGLVYWATESLPRPDPHLALFPLYVMRGDYVTTRHADFFTRHVIAYYAAAQNNLGVESANAGDWSKAAARYRAALEIEPDQAAARQNLAVALQKMAKLL